MSILTEPHREQRPLHSKTSATIQHFLAQKQKKKEKEKRADNCAHFLSANAADKSLKPWEQPRPQPRLSKIPNFLLCFLFATI